MKFVRLVHISQMAPMDIGTVKSVLAPAQQHYIVCLRAQAHSISLLCGYIKLEMYVFNATDTVFTVSRLACRETFTYQTHTRQHENINNHVFNVERARNALVRACSYFGWFMRRSTAVPKISVHDLLRTPGSRVRAKMD